MAGVHVNGRHVFAPAFAGSGALLWLAQPIAREADESVSRSGCRQAGKTPANLGKTAI
ncbi:hypothetical protein MPLB_790122 [Mesorhizobium sp. ORS 3324]|nr:hypothetical protein MPLB_790122 [Mesorhizobium sp. ORS 3324]